MNVDSLSTISMINTISFVGWTNLIFIGVLALIFGMRWLATRTRATEIQPTWGCAYEALVPKAQYTGMSFAKGFAGLFNFLLIEKKKYSKIEKTDLFPKRRTFTSTYFDIFENYLINPIINRLRFTTNYFQFIQNGQIQAYVLYGILFIIVVFIGTLFGLI